jgi:DinB superfamily
MDVRTTLREQMQALHGTMEAAIADCSPDVCARKVPGSTINAIGPIYAHTIFGEDGLLNGLIQGKKPVYYAGEWAPKVGLDMPKGGMEPDWSVTLDLEVFRQYAAAVYKATDEYLSTVSAEDLDRVIEPGFAPPMPVRTFIANILAWHVATHQGEISALKGVQGFNGLDLTH